MPVTKHVTEADFATEVLESSKPVLVDFWAEWCGPCKAVAPVLDQIIDEHGDKIEIVKLDVDANPQIAMDFQITGIPVMKLFKDGEVVKSILGAKPKTAIEAELAEYLA